MKITLVGAATLAVVLFPTFTFFFTLSIWPILILVAVKYGFGEAAARRLYPWFNKSQDIQMGSWFVFVPMVLQLLGKTQVSYTVVDGAGQDHVEKATGAAKTAVAGRAAPDLRRVLAPSATPGKVKIVILNHHCRVDWVYFFFLCARSEIHSSLRIVLKEDIKRAPMVGSVMENYRYMFLSRSWATDEAYLQEVVNYYKRTNDSVVLLIFPEGTDLSASNVVKSQEYAKKNNLPVFHHVLNPRTTGLVALKNMFGAENVEEIVDCTIGYTYAKPGSRPSEPSLVNGLQPRKVSFLLRRYRADSTNAPNADSLTDIAPVADDAAFSQWVHERFAEKEQLLSRFYANNPVGFDDHDVRAVMGQGCGVVCHDRYPNGIMNVPIQDQVKDIVADIGVARVALVIFFWFVLPSYMAMRLGLLFLMLYIPIGTFALTKISQRLKGIQRAVLLDEVKEEDALVNKLMGGKRQKTS